MILDERGKKGARAGPWGPFPRVLNRGPPSPFPRFPVSPPFSPGFRRSPPVFLLFGDLIFFGIVTMEP